MINRADPVMKWLYIFGLSLFACLIACDTVHIFSPASPAITATAPSRIMVRAVIGNDPAHPWQTMEIRDDGLATVRGHRQYQEKRTRLSGQEVRILTEQFVQKKFMQMPERLVDKSNFSPAYYEIAFCTGLDSNKVYTNDLVNNASLAQLLSLLDATVERVIDDGLEFTLQLSQPAVLSGGSTVLQLKVRNRASTPLLLSFSSGQLYRFIVQPSAYAQTGVRQEVSTLNQATRESVPAMTEGLLHSGEQISYAFPWDGRTAMGSREAGTVLVSAELLSIPGGITAPVSIIIN